MGHLNFLVLKKCIVWITIASGMLMIFLGSHWFYGKSELLLFFNQILILLSTLLFLRNERIGVRISAVSLLIPCLVFNQSLNTLLWFCAYSFILLGYALAPFFKSNKPRKLAYFVLSLLIVPFLFVLGSPLSDTTWIFLLYGFLGVSICNYFFEELSPTRVGIQVYWYIALRTIVLYLAVKEVDILRGIGMSFSLVFLLFGIVLVVSSKNWTQWLLSNEFILSALFLSIVSFLPNLLIEKLLFIHFVFSIVSFYGVQRLYNKKFEDQLKVPFIYGLGGIQSLFVLILVFGSNIFKIEFNYGLAVVTIYITTVILGQLTFKKSSMIFEGI